MPCTNAHTGEAGLSPPFALFTESIYRRGARRWRKLYYASGHAFQAKRFNRVRHDAELHIFYIITVELFYWGR